MLLHPLARIQGYISISCRNLWNKLRVSALGQLSIASLSTTSSSFDSLFRVLLIFPSWYLCAIGLPTCHVFSLGWCIPPARTCAHTDTKCLLPHLRRERNTPCPHTHTPWSSGCTFKQPDSLTPKQPIILCQQVKVSTQPRWTGFSPSLIRLSRRIPGLPAVSVVAVTTLQFRRPFIILMPTCFLTTHRHHQGLGFQAWAILFSLAVTLRITVVFFSSAY